jgi:hypothetical protein
LVSRPHKINAMGVRWSIAATSGAAIRARSAQTNGRQDVSLSDLEALLRRSGESKL